MAGGSIIGALRVVLGADTAKFEDGLRDAHKSLATFGANVAKGAAVVAASAGVMGAALAVAMKHAVDEADKIGKTAQKIGIPVEELSKLKHAADLSGIGMEGLSTAVGKLSKNMVEAAAKPMSEAANAFKALGVSVTDSSGKLRSSTEVMTDVAGKFEGLKDGAGKTAIAMAIFGKSGKDMIPLLNSGAAGLKEMMDEAAKLGIVIDSKTAKSAEAFNDNLTRLGKVKDAIVLKITEGMLPAMEKLSATMVQTAKDSDGLRAVGEIVGAGLKVLATIAVATSAAFKQMALDFNAVVNAGRLIASGEFSKAADVFKQLVVDTNKLHTAANDTTNALWGLGDPLKNFSAWAGEEAFGKVTKPLKEFNYALLAGKQALDSFLDSQKKSQAAIQADIASYDLAVGGKERLRVVLQGLAIAQANSIPLTDTLRQKISEAGFAAEQSALKLAGLKLREDTLLPWEQFNQTLERNAQILAANPALAETVARANQKAAEAAGVSWNIAGASIAGSFADIAGSFGKSNSAMATAAKGFSIAQAIMSTYTGAAKALELPFPANIAAMATVLAKGFAFVASIKSTAVPKFAAGGSYKVPGGIGGSDRVQSIAAFPGERVTVERPDQMGGGLGNAGGGDNRPIAPIVVQGDAFSADGVRQLVSKIEDLVANGLRPKLVPA